MARYPDVRDAELVGTYPVQVGAGGGYVWDEVLEYRVWCSPELGAPDVADGSDCFYPLASFEEAAKDARRHRGAESPLALVLQKEYVEEAEERRVDACSARTAHRVARRLPSSPTTNGPDHPRRQGPA